MESIFTNLPHIRNERELREALVHCDKATSRQLYHKDSDHLHSIVVKVDSNDVVFNIHMTNFIKLAICNMPKVQTSHSKPSKSHL